MIKLEIYDPKTKETKVHKVDFVSTRWLMKALELQARTYESEFEQVNALIEYVASLFDISVDEILDGTPSAEITDTLQNIVFDVLGFDEKKAGFDTGTSGKNLTPQEALDHIDNIFLELMKQGWSYDDIANADYYHLMRVLGEKKQKKEVMDLAEFIERI